MIRGFAMTSSITTMMASCLAVFAPQTINSNTFRDVADRCQKILTSLGDFSDGVFGYEPWKRIVYLGSGGLQGAARESALKVLELTAGKLAAFYDSPAGFRHGPKSLVDNETLVVVMVSSHPYTRQYDPIYWPNCVATTSHARGGNSGRKRRRRRSRPTLHPVTAVFRTFSDVEQAFAAS